MSTVLLTCPLYPSSSYLGYCLQIVILLLSDVKLFLIPRRSCHWQPNQAYSFFFWLKSSHNQSSCFPATFKFSQRYCSYQWVLFSLDVSKYNSINGVIFAFREISGLCSSSTHLFVFLAVQDISKLCSSIDNNTTTDFSSSVTEYIWRWFIFKENK